MPTTEENLRSWSETYDWPEGGEEWSKAWGGSEAQWFFVIFPRIHLFLPTDTILEIAPGYGRWTQYLAAHCGRLVGVDLSATCVDACTRRFRQVPHASFQQNDGYSLTAVPDQSVDFAFSFDSLVHAEHDVIAAYLRELARALKPSGVAFIHHSNLGAMQDPDTGALRAGIGNPHWRAASVSADTVAGECAPAGLSCVSQELANWGVDYLSDCMSVVTPSQSPWARETVRLENPNFMKEANHVAAVARAYVRARAGV